MVIQISPKALVVEDEALIAMYLEQALTSLGYRVVGTVGDGVSAVEASRQLSPDVILMDVKLPLMDGIEAARAILSDRLVPIVLITAYSDPELAERAVEAGVAAYMVKPVDDRDLLPVLEIARQRTKTTQELVGEVEELREAMETRKLVERAKGILMDYLSLSEQEAYRKLQMQSRNQNRRLRDVAKSVIEASEFLVPNTSGKANGSRPYRKAG